MSWIDDFCNSKDLNTTEKKACLEFATNIYEIFEDMKTKGYLRSTLKSKKGEEERVNYKKIIDNVRNVNDSFNKFLDIYVDRTIPNSNQRLKKFLDNNKAYGLTEKNLVYLLISEMIFTFLANIEEFRSALLLSMKLPIKEGKKELIKENTTLGTLLRSLVDLKIKNASELNVIDFNLRNGLSHGLWWIEGKNNENEPEMSYSKDMTFKKIETIKLSNLFMKTRKQILYTNCLFNVIAAWFL